MAQSLKTTTPQAKSHAAGYLVDTCLGNSCIILHYVLSHCPSSQHSGHQTVDQLQPIHQDGAASSPGYCHHMDHVN